MEDTKFLDIGVAKLDINRLERKGVPEIIYAEGKKKEHLKKIVIAFLEKKGYAIISRIDKDTYTYLDKEVSNSYKRIYYEDGNILFFGEISVKKRAKGKAAIISAGTSDYPIACETKTIMEIMGCKVDMILDVGISSLWRILHYQERLKEYKVIVVIAGMEGALPTVISSLVDIPIIAVPTSIGYGANLNGIASLLTMLNSCSPGIAVVNIDGGIQAGIFAYLVLSS